MEGFQVGRTRVDQVLPPEQAAQVLAGVDEVYRSGEAQNRELSARLPAGEFRFDLRLSPICAASGEVRCVVVVSRDITEPRRAMNALCGREQ